MDQIIVSLVQAHPSIATVLLVIGGLRVVLKPLMVFIEQYVKGTPDTGDDAKLAAVESSKAYKVLVFILDYTASIKLNK